MNYHASVVLYRCLSLLLELEEQRATLVQSGALARLLPYLEVALQERVDELKQASGCGCAPLCWGSCS